MAKDTKILSLKWIDQQGEKVLESAKVIEVSAQSAELNLRVNKSLQFPKYAPVSDVKKYMVEKLVQAPSAPIEPAPSEPVKFEVVEPTTEPTKEPTKEAKAKKPVFKTVEEKVEWEKQNGK